MCEEDLIDLVNTNYEISTGIESLIDSYNQLDRYSNIIQTSINNNNYLTKREISSLDSSLKSLHNRFNFPKSISKELPSMESFNDTVTAKQFTYLTLESIENDKQSIWATIWKWIKQLIINFKEFIEQIWTGNEQVKKRIDKLEKELPSYNNKLLSKESTTSLKLVKAFGYNINNKEVNADEVMGCLYVHKTTTESFTNYIEKTINEITDINKEFSHKVKKTIDDKVHNIKNKKSIEEEADDTNKEELGKQYWYTIKEKTFDINKNLTVSLITPSNNPTLIGGRFIDFKLNQRYEVMNFEVSNLFDATHLKESILLADRNEVKDVIKHVKDIYDKNIILIKQKPNLVKFMEDIEKFLKDNLEYASEMFTMELPNLKYENGKFSTEKEKIVDYIKIETKYIESEMKAISSGLQFTSFLLQKTIQFMSVLNIQAMNRGLDYCDESLSKYKISTNVSKSHSIA